MALAAGSLPPTLWQVRIGQPQGLEMRALPSLQLQSVVGNVMPTLTGRTPPLPCGAWQAGCGLLSQPAHARWLDYRGCISGLLAIISFSLSAAGSGAGSLPSSLCPITGGLFSPQPGLHRAATSVPNPGFSRRVRADPPGCCPTSPPLEAHICLPGSVWSEA